MDTTALLNKLAQAYAHQAATELETSAAERAIPQIPVFLGQANNMVSLEVLVDPAIVRQAIQSLGAGNNVEETLMFTFMLYIARLLQKSSGHPLEVGIIRQKIIGMVPMFEQAAQKQLIREEMYSSNAAMLMAIADKTEDAESALQTLLAGYERFSKPITA